MPIGARRVAACSSRPSHNPKKHSIIGITFQGVPHIEQRHLPSQEENGGAPGSIPEDIWYVTLAVENEGLSFAAGPDVELGEDQTLHMRTLSPGSDAIELYLEGPPELQWLCGPIEVTEQS